MNIISFHHHRLSLNFNMNLHVHVAAVLFSVWIAQVTAPCTETHVLPPSPTCLGEDGRFKCCLGSATSFAWIFNGTFLPNPDYNASISRDSATLCETLSIPAMLEYNKTGVQCVVPGELESMDCEPVYFFTEDCDDHLPGPLSPSPTATLVGNTNSSLPSTLVPTSSPTGGPTDGPDSNPTTVSGGTIAGIVIGAGAGIATLVSCVLIGICGHKSGTYDTSAQEPKSQVSPSSDSPPKPVRVESEPNLLKSELEFCRTNLSVPDAESKTDKMESGISDRRLPRSTSHADISRHDGISRYDGKSQGDETSDTCMNVFKDMSEDNSPRSPPVLRAEDDCEEDNFGAEKLFKGMVPIMPSDRTEGFMIRSPSYMLNKEELITGLALQEQLCAQYI